MLWIMCSSALGYIYHRLKKHLRRICVPSVYKHCSFDFSSRGCFSDSFMAYKYSSNKFPSASYERVTQLSNNGCWKPRVTILLGFYKSSPPLPPPSCSSWLVKDQETWWGQLHQCNRLSLLKPGLGHTCQVHVLLFQIGMQNGTTAVMEQSKHS